MSENVERFKNYYGMNNTITNLYNNGGNRYNNLFRLVIKENNIKLAIKKLSLNSGRNTSGPDGMTFEDLKNMDFDVLIKSIKERLHLRKKPHGRKVNIPKTNGGTRTLGITNILDRLAQQCILNILEPICESIFLPSSFGFRLNLQAKHCVATFNNSMWACVHQGYEYTVIDADLTKCFDNISLDRVLNVLRDKFGIHDKKFLCCIKGLMSINYGKEKYNGIGLAQGSILGPILCNCLLHLLDEYMDTLSVRHPNYINMVKKGRLHYNKLDYNSFRTKFNNCFMIRYVRYADDFLIGCAYKEDAPIIINLVKDFLRNNIGVNLNENKTCLRTMSKYGNESICFLGFKIKTTKGHIRISPKDYSGICKNIKKESRKILFKMSMKREKNIYELNSLLSSYINYYDICTNLDPLITYCNRILYRKGYKGLNVLQKEFEKDIYVSKRDYKGRKSIIDLYGLRRLSSQSYKDYIKVPYWKPNSDNEFQWINQISNYKESFKNIYLHGLLIKYPKDYITGIEFKKTLYIDIHHKLPVQFGGKDTFDNLIPLSKYSHTLVHCNKESVKKYYNPNTNLSVIKLNKLRKLANVEPINANDLI